MIQILTDIVIGGGFLAVVYRLYLAIAAGKEKLVEIKNDTIVQQDEVTDAKQETKIATDQTAFDNAISKFNSDTK
jgi:hypothetical protein